MQRRKEEKEIKEKKERIQKAREARAKAAEDAKNNPSSEGMPGGMDDLGGLGMQTFEYWNDVVFVFYIILVFVNQRALY